MQLWFTEEQKPQMHLSLQVKEVLLQKTSHYQQIAVLDTEIFGRVLALDGYIQVTQLDEFIYHEMMAHPPLVTQGNPREVLVIGGGDGGTVREVLRHPGVEKVTLVEIDREVAEASRAFFPEVSSCLDHPRVELRWEDGVAFLKDKEEAYDVIIIDSTEPVGPAKTLFSFDFYRRVEKALKEGGVTAAQTESPFHNQGLVRTSWQYLEQLFPVAAVYTAPIPSYPGGLWSFALGSRYRDPREISPQEGEFLWGQCRYYTPEIHRSAFTLPPAFASLREVESG